MRIHNILLVALLLAAPLPLAAAQDPFPVCVGPNPPDECGPCYGPCAWVPSTDAPVPSREESLVTAGGACREGSYGIACSDSEDCIKQFWMFAECRSDLVCAARARDVCVWGFSYTNARDFVEIVAHRMVPAAPELTPSELPTVLPADDALVAVSGKCGGATVELACDYRATSNEWCVFPHPLSPCQDGDSFMCFVSVQGACSYGLWVNSDLICFGLGVCREQCDAGRLYVCQGRNDASRGSPSPADPILI